MYFYCNYNILLTVVHHNLHCIIIMTVSVSHGVRPSVDFMKVNEDDDDDHMLSKCYLHV